jgi:hypothetical protein
MGPDASVRQPITRWKVRQEYHVSESVRCLRRTVRYEGHFVGGKKGVKRREAVQHGKIYPPLLSWTGQIASRTPTLKVRGPYGEY